MCLGCHCQYPEDCVPPPFGKGTAPVIASNLIFVDVATVGAALKMLITWAKNIL